MKSLFKKGYFLLFITGFLACSEQQKDQTSSLTDEPEEENAVEPADESDKEDKQIQAINLWPKTGLYDGSGDDKKWLSSVSFGSKLILTGDSSATNKKTFVHVIAPDGSKGWVNAYVIAPKAEIAVITQTTPLYDNPDILAMSDFKLAFGDFVAVKKEPRGGFYQVQTKEKKHNGWLKGKNVFSSRDVDIEVALLRQRAMELEGDERARAIEEIVENESYSTSVFYEVLSDELLESTVKQNIDQELTKAMDEEMEDNSEDSSLEDEEF